MHFCVSGSFGRKMIPHEQKCQSNKRVASVANDGLAVPAKSALLKIPEEENPGERNERFVAQQSECIKHAAR